VAACLLFLCGAGRRRFGICCVPRYLRDATFIDWRVGLGLPWTHRNPDFSYSGETPCWRGQRNAHMLFSICHQVKRAIAGASSFVLIFSAAPSAARYARAFGMLWAFAGRRACSPGVLCPSANLSPLFQRRMVWFSRAVHGAGRTCVGGGRAAACMWAYLCAGERRTAAVRRDAFCLWLTAPRRAYYTTGALYRARRTGWQTDRDMVRLRGEHRDGNVYNVMVSDLFSACC